MSGGDLRRVVGATIDDDHHLVGDPGLGRERFERLADQQRLVVRGNHDDDSSGPGVTDIAHVLGFCSPVVGQIPPLLHEGGTDDGSQRVAEVAQRGNRDSSNRIRDVSEIDGFTNNRIVREAGLITTPCTNSSGTREGRWEIPEYRAGLVVQGVIGRDAGREREMADISDPGLTLHVLRRFRGGARADREIQTLIHALAPRLRGAVS